MHIIENTFVLRPVHGRCVTVKQRGRIPDWLFGAVTLILLQGNYFRSFVLFMMDKSIKIADKGIDNHDTGEEQHENNCL